MSYSVVIRSLISDPEILKKELEEIFSQTVKPDKVIIYIPRDYKRPEFQVAYEEYQFVKKGMMAQRLLPYNDIESKYILMLDDDITLPPNSVEKLITAMEENDADCVGVDTFQTYKLPLMQKIYAIIVNLVFPHFDAKWFFKIKKNGSFSYLYNPKKNFYWSQKCDGNVMLWRKDSYKKINLEDELWLDKCKFAYNEDMVESYKVFKNGMKLGIYCFSGIIHLNIGSASKPFRNSKEWIYLRTKAQTLIWWRTCFNPGDINKRQKIHAAFSFAFKSFWLLIVMFGASIVKLNPRFLSGYCQGLKAGWKFIHSSQFKSLPPYSFLKN